MQIADGAGEVDGGAEHRTHDDHVAATGLGGLDIVDAIGDKGEAWGIDQHVDDGSEVIARSPDSTLYLCEILKGEHEESYNDEPARVLVSLVLPFYVQTAHHQQGCINHHEDEAAKLKQV